jgi:hypothetical protein
LPSQQPALPSAAEQVIGAPDEPEEVDEVELVELVEVDVEVLLVDELLLVVPPQ